METDVGLAWPGLAADVTGEAVLPARREAIKVEVSSVFVMLLECLLG
jgi:hypothetical protein